MTQFQYLQKKLLSSESTKELHQTFEDILSLDSTKMHLNPYFSYGILRRSFDSGMMMNRQLLCSRMKIHTTPGVLILKRSSLIHLLIQHLYDENGYYNNTQTTFFLIDIKNLRSADFPDQLGNKAADFILNNVATRLDQMCRNELPKITPAQPYIGRYGGDEFLLAVTGLISPESIAKINSLIPAEVRKEFGFFKQNNGKVVFRPVEIKNNACEIITIPEHKEKRLIFLHYLKQQLLLNTRDLDNIYKISGEQDIETIQHEYDLNRNACIYQSNKFNIEEKIQHFEKTKPDLCTIIELAKKLDDVSRNHQKNHQIRLLSFIESVVYDRLLNEEVRGFGDIGMELQNGAFDMLYAFDMKFIKELNDQFSVLQGDMVILGLFQHISCLFDRKEKQEGVYFARRGGTILVGIKKNYSLSCESHKGLKAFLANRTIHILNAYFDITIPIGVAVYDFATNKENHRYEVAIDTLITEAIDTWYEMVVPLFLKNETQIKDFIEQIELRQVVSETPDLKLVCTKKIQVISLLHLYFLGGHSCSFYEGNVLPIRYVDRIKGLIEHISTSGTQVVIESGIKTRLLEFVETLTNLE
jgi:GGDEF domain-containing protein